MNTDIYIKQLIRNYELYQEQATSTYLLESLRKVDELKGDAWDKIMQYWSQINHEFEVHVVDEKSEIKKLDVDDHQLVISILGIKLNDDGSMNDELISRLNVGLKLANTYPNAYLVVTGGPTAKNNPNVTEGGQMANWLLNQGISQERIIVENRAPDTVGNAVYTYEILKEKYPFVDSIILVSSDYHVSRGCLLYYATMMLAALKFNGKQLKIVSNAGCKTNNPGYETIALQAWSLCQVANIDYWKLSVELE